MFKILFGQLVERILENKSLHEREAPTPAGRRMRLWNIFLALPVKNGSYLLLLKFREDTVALGVGPQANKGNMLGNARENYWFLCPVARGKFNTHITYKHIILNKREA